MTAAPRLAGPRGLPLLGHLLQYRRHQLDFLVRCAARYGDVVQLHIGTSTLLLTHPDDIRHVLVTRPEHYAKTVRISGTRGRLALGRGLLTSQGADHLKQRRAMQPLFHPRALEAFTAVIVDAARTWCAAREEGTTVDMAEEMRTLAQAIMIKTLFGTGDLDDDGALAKAIAVRRRYYEHVLGALLPLPAYHHPRRLLEYRAAIRDIDAILRKALDRRRASGLRSHDMLSGFMHARYDDGTTMTDDHIRTEALTFMDTGYETIGAALTWTWYLLAQHPHVDAALAAEFQTALDGQPPDTGTSRTLRYAEMILMESMRLYPPTWNFVRTVLKEDTLPCGVRVMPGSQLFLCQYIVHHNSRYYADPERFDPERFRDKPDKERPRYTYFPFGGGAHVCLGETFAELECLLVLAVLAQRFRFTMDPGPPVRLNAGLALRPRDGIRMRVHARDSRRPISSNQAHAAP